MLRVLITGLRSPATPGTLRMLRENRDGEEIITYGVDDNATIFSKNLADHFFPVPHFNHPDYIPTLLEICKREKIDLILFHQDDDAIACASHGEAFEALKVRLLCVDFTTLKTSANKGRLYQILKGKGIPIPDHEVVTKEECVEAAYRLGYPKRDLVAKPLASCGAKGTYQISEKPLLWDRRPSLPLATLSQLQRDLSIPVLLMEALPGEEFSVDAVLNRSGGIAIPRRRDLIVGGVATRTTLVHRPDLADWTLKAGQALGLRYLYGMQFKCDEEGNPKLLECNPRIQGSSVASMLSGVNLLWIAIRELFGKEPHPEPVPTFGATFSRNWEGVST